MKAWPEDLIQWLRENVPGHSAKEVSEAALQQGICGKYGIDLTEAAVKNAKKRYKIKSGTKRGWKKGYSRKYPQGMCRFITGIAEGKSTKELVEEVNREYGPGTITESQMRAYKKNHKITTGLTGQFQKGRIPANKGKKMSREQYEKCRTTMFRTGHTPANTMQVGEETHTTDGYRIRKVRDTGTQRERFAFVHRETWERHNGPIPDGKIVSFLDGDKDNCDIGNLVLLDNLENLELNRTGLRFENGELTSAGVQVARLRIAARNKERTSG